MDTAKMPMIMLGGMNGLEDAEEKSFITPAENRANTQMVIDDWMLGPEKPSNERGANPEFWRALARAMQVEESEARRRRCGNCEYYDNTVMTQIKMETIPWNQWDVGAGFRGYCHKFDFCCHDLRACQAWEERDYEAED